MVQVDAGAGLFDYDPLAPILYSLRDTGATVDVNTLPVEVIDQLMTQYGFAPQLAGRKDFLLKTKKNAADKELAGAALQKEVQKRTQAELGQKLNKLLDFAEMSTVGKIKRNADSGRGRLIEEAAANNALGQPGINSLLSEYDQNTDASIGDFLGTSALNRANQEFDYSKFLENLLYGERRAAEGVDQFNKNFDFGVNSMQAQINEAAAGRALQKELFQANQKLQVDAMTPGWDDKFMQGLGGFNTTANTFINAKKAGEDDSSAKFLKLLMAGA